MSLRSAPAFSDLLAEARHSVVRVEMRDHYGVESEAAEFAEWRKHRTIAPDALETARPWVEMIQGAVRRGVRVQRARIVSLPASEYIRFEHASTFVNLAAGEEVRWLPRRLATDLALPGTDFWLFDDRLIRFGHFAGDGAVIGHEMNDDPATVRLCSNAFAAVWERATPHEEFVI
ncbi:DUF6879 family protein [Streptomyces sp. NPDC090022]|uniref:DUF6879 family protein n=1 Tax=Streptomyces sp. NPDC090022 TaxID=3365920 RepID=UPI003820736E